LPKHAKPESGEDPFFCLLEDDNLITEIKVTTDRLLVPQREAEGVHDVVLMIHVAADIVGVDNGNDFVFATHDDGKIIEY
jgi:hypothetical protein